MKTIEELLGEYNRYCEQSPNLSEWARLTLAERILQQMNDAYLRRDQAAIELRRRRERLRIKARPVRIERSWADNG